MAMPAKGSEPASEKIMEVAKMKPLLALSKREPVQAAVALTSDGDGVVLLDKKMKPKKVLATLKAEAAKAKIQLQTATIRFGKAEVDTDYDPGMVRFFINKEAPGNMRAKLVIVFKQIAYQKVEFNVDPTFEEEPEDEDETQQTTTSDTAPSLSAPPPVPPPAPPVDLTALVNTLGQLTLAIPKVAGGDAGLQTSLVALATAAQATLKAARADPKATDLPAKASQEIEALRSALAVAMEQAKQKGQGAGAGAADFEKSRDIWLKIRTKVETDIETLRQRIIDTFKDDPVAPQLDASYKAKVAPVLTTLDESLAVTFGAATKATDATQRAKLVAEAKAIMQKYEQYVTSEPLLKDLDENPFVPLSIRATVGGTVATLLRAAH